jgi:hypothetical protein
MQFDATQVIEALHAEWRWILSEISEVLAVSSMGNVCLVDNQQSYWRICPEELSAEIIARSASELDSWFADPDAKADWQMSGMVSEMIELYGEPELGECFGLVIPGVLGGKYSSENIRRRSLYDYLRFTGDLARQIKDLKDGETIELKLA